MMKSVLLVLCGILVGCAAAGAASVAGHPGGNVAHAAAGVQQYCTTSGDFNNVEALNTLVKRAGAQGWELIGVYRPAQLGATYEDYVCFHRTGGEASP